MDALTGFLRGPRAEQAFLLRASLSPPWSLSIRDEAPLSVVAVVRGAAWIVAGVSERLGPGDVALIGGPEHYVVADDPDTAPQVIIWPGQLCTTIGGVSVSAEMTLGVRSWGNAADGETVLLTGTYQRAGEVSRRLLDALPGVLVLRGEQWRSPVVELLASEIVRDEVGQEIVLDRLLDLVTITALRSWLSREARAGWFTAQADPIAGRALRLLHDDSARAWTLTSLADAVGVSRAALARRFQQAVGEPAMSYLAGWRLALAADLLRDPAVTVSAVAREVGYSSPFTFSHAFKRQYGVSPQAYRSTPTERARSGS